MHHSKFNGNYGVHFRFWDKPFGTEFKDYEATFDAIQNRKSGVVAKETAEIGEVSMKRTDALSTEELNNGMISNSSFIRP